MMSRDIICGNPQERALTQKMAKATLIDKTRPDQTYSYTLKSSLKRFSHSLDKFPLLPKIRRIIHNHLWGKDRKHFHFFSRTNFDRIPYIIRRADPTVGLFSYFITILGALAYADEKGYTPVVDMKNYMNAYLYPSELGRVNSWEYFFEQPGGVSLEEALSCRKYITGRDSIRFPCPGWPAENIRELFANTGGKLDYWRGICRKYISLSQEVLALLEKETQKFSGKRVLGVSLRGTDYIALRPHGHPVQPTAEQAIAKAQEVMTAGNYDAIYLAVEDAGYIKVFRDAFGEKLVLSDRNAIDFDYNAGKLIMHYWTDRRENDKYLTGLEYLVSMLMLIKCNGLITSMTSGAAGVMCLSEGFEYLHVFDLGVYP